MAIRIALCQFNPCVGDFEGNVAAMRRLCAGAAKAGADVVVFGELAVCGYPPEDLLLKRDFLEQNRAAVEQLAASCTGPVVIAGFADVQDGRRYNAAAVLREGRIEKVYHKCRLPNYGVFDEQRYFAAGAGPVGVETGGVRLAITICEDIWQQELPGGRRVGGHQWLRDFLAPLGPVDVLVNLSASPFHAGKVKIRQQVLSDCAKDLACAVAYCNIIGGQDELVFDGQSMFVDSDGAIERAPAFVEQVLIGEVGGTEDGRVQVAVPEPAATGEIDVLDEIYGALVVGVRDYVRKNGFEKVLVGLSGGIDSAVTAAIAAAALGPENVTAVTMPSRFNSPQGIEDTRKLSKNLEVRLLNVPIGPVLDKFNDTLAGVDGWDDKGVAYENLQARIRGCILMSLSNQFGQMVLTTGNKSEMAVGYATLYGDMAGGFAVLKDVPKTVVYRLAGHINRVARGQVIPENVIKKVPSAELRPEQKDTDSLPEYELLDKVLTGYVEKDRSVRELIEDDNLPSDVVRRVIQMVDRNEYKRRQSPPGVKITPKAFGKDRRLPITNCYRPGV